MATLLFVCLISLFFSQAQTYDGSTYENKKSRLPGFSIRVSNDTTVPTSSSSCYTSLQSDDMRTVIEKACERTTRYVWIYQNHTAAGDVCPILEICEVQVFGDPIEVTDSRMAIQSTTERLMNASQLLKSIIIEDGKKDVKFIQVTVSGILHMMENTTLPTKEISAGNLNTTLDILDMIVNITGPAIENTQTKLDENDISFPEVLSSNTSDNSNEMSTFLELPKQNINASKDMQYVAIIYKTLPELLSLDHHRNEKKKNQTGKSKTKTFVNSAILSLTTQNDIGILDPPLALTFRHIVNAGIAQLVSKTKNCNNFYWPEQYENIYYTKSVFVYNKCVYVEKQGCETGYYGDHCRHNCDHCMNKANCGITDGRCDGSGYATSGYQPPQCTACLKDKYGNDCEYTCGHCYNNASCDRNDGTCSNGCEKGYRGSDCKQRDLGNSLMTINSTTERLKNTSQLVRFNFLF
uniref:Multiple epidermal growth factor-like domains 6 n=1 Tax=Magallana gigas TaxID=29159 RepID=K1PLR9_MAGGI